MADEALPAGRHWVVDGMNVIGSRPDGWWRDRFGAQRRLADELAGMAWPPGSRVTVVFDGRPWPQDGASVPAGRDSAPVSSPGHLAPEVLFAAGGRNAADGRIVELVGDAADPGAVVVVTADRALAAEVARLGAGVVRPGRLPRGR